MNWRSRGRAFAVSLLARLRGWRPVVAWIVTALAFLLVGFALIAPNDLNQYSLGAFLRVPVEGLIGVAIVLAVPTRARRITAATMGALLGVLTLLKVFDLGFFRVLYRPFDPVLDWAFVSAGVDFITTTAGKTAAIGAVIGAVLVAIAVPVLMALSAVRLTRVASQHRIAALRTVALLVVACFAVGPPFASTSAADYAYLHAMQVPAGIRDAREFAKEVAVDSFRDTPGDDLLKSLRGKDVVLTFVESYGRSAIEHPDLAPEIGAVLDDGTNRLRAKGFSARSAFVTSPTYGGGSWLAHATLTSGLWIDNQQRYRNLVTSDRLTIDRAFQRAGWRTVGVEPAVTQAWPEGAFFGYDQIYEAGDLGYHGPRFSYATMPDQYILSAFQRSERAAPSHDPVMAQITTLSSHAPWAPIPALIDWNDIGDGSVYKTMAGSNAQPESIFSRASPRVRTDYGLSIRYALNNLISYVETYGDDNLVLIFLGDHQPATLVTGEGASHDVPITIVAHDPAVLDRISGWGWQNGLKPDPQAPVWRMNEFRDRFLSAFG
jgi:uncharacterized membrane protein YidH (DUF202 family)